MENRGRRTEGRGRKSEGRRQLEVFDEPHPLAPSPKREGECPHLVVSSWQSAVKRDGRSEG